MIKLVVTDMDGTLLTVSQSISKKNLEAIHLLKEKGIEFAIASGRDHDGVYSTMDKYNIKCDCILGNGAQYEDKDGHLLKECYMDHSVLKDVFHVFDQDNIPYMIFTKQGFFTTYKDNYVRDEFIRRCHVRFGNTADEYKEGGTYAHSPCMLLKYIEDVDTFIKSDIDVIKVEAFKAEAKEIIAPKKRLESIKNIAYLSSFNDNVEVTAPDAQKGNILEEVIKIKGLHHDEVAVMGDGMNDLTLFEKFRYSFAPDNAVEEIKSLAYNVSNLNCHEDSFAQQIDLILKL